MSNEYLDYLRLVWETVKGRIPIVKPLIENVP